MRLGVCYYPEHWPETQWAEDARQMSELGISVVRIGEFAWSRLEPESGRFDFDWLDRAITTLADAGLTIVLGTPTATPPKWLVDAHPDILAVDSAGQTRGFGSRRHYCFSSGTYREHCRRIVRALADHFGKHEAIEAWQTDNEYGCHDTTLSYSENAILGFRRWCSQRYSSIEELNHLWGNVFWSMEYQTFDQIDLPFASVTETNPAQRMAFWRYSSDQVKSFNRLQVDILRRLSPGKALLHNFMGNFTDFDHYAVGEDLDIASWDNYPLGFLDRDGNDTKMKSDYLRTGHPDSSAFHHDLYRSVGQGRCWVMEQQPGPVNWAPHNPAPLDGMLRLWGWEAYAHGVEVMSWFRWRQAPFAQEQMHTGLCRPDGSLDSGAQEVAILSAELTLLDDAIDTTAVVEDTADIAIIHDYASLEMQKILRFGGDAHDPEQYLLSVYSTCRKAGFSIDVVPPTADLSNYKLILLVNYCFNDRQLAGKLSGVDGTILMFPGTGSRTTECTIANGLAPGHFKQLIDITVSRTESVPDFVKLIANSEHTRYSARHWREKIDSPISPEARFDDHWGFHYRSDKVHYLNAILHDTDLEQFMIGIMSEAGLSPEPGTEGLRYESRGKIRFAFNYGPAAAELPETIKPLIGQRKLEPADVAVWIEEDTAGGSKQ